ncbi:MAG: cytochrome c3 family protein, partial [Desulfuromonadaceae bacterium]|nr:cytochrome c3 family protein [Desulfuromonadaceae bacterium]
MKKSTSIALMVLAQGLLFAVGAFAALIVSHPHYDETVGFVCITCHTTHLALGSTGYNNVCQNCHRPGDPAAGLKPITPADAANPFGNHSTTGINRMYQTSHRWDGSDTSPAAGAEPPVQAQMTTSGLRVRTRGQLACVRCHNQHSNTNGSFLRVANDTDQLCLDCHRSRNTADQAKGTHPVGIDYQQSAAANPSGFNSVPLNANPSNPTSAMKLLNGTVSCSTCHGVHGTDSRSSTIDGSANFANLSSGDGNLLRTDKRGAAVVAGAADNLNVCTNCHANKTNHNKHGQDVQCTDCHGAHVEYDEAASGSEATPNIYLVRRYLKYSSATRISKRIIYNSTSNKNFYSPIGGGVCQSCHNPPANHLSGTAVELGHLNCATCHNHDEPRGAFSVGACGTCHLIATSNPPLATGSHTAHFAVIAGSDPLLVCTKCHLFTGDSGSTHANGTVDVNNSCNSCHGQGTPVWGAVYAAPGSTFPYSSLQCDKCHSGSAASIP